MRQHILSLYFPNSISVIAYFFFFFQSTFLIMEKKIESKKFKSYSNSLVLPLLFEYKPLLILIIICYILLKHMYD